MTMSVFGRTSAGMVMMFAAACGGGERNVEAPAAASAAPATAASAPAATATNTNNRCPLTVEQVAAVTGAPMTLTEGSCTFFPANGRDIPHVFFVLQNPMVCTSIKPGEVGFTEAVTGLPVREAYVRDALDGAHVLVCPNGNARAFDVVVELRNDKPQNREAAIGLAKQVLAGP